MRKTVTKTIYEVKEAMIEYQWVRRETEPDAPTGYIRAPEWDFDFGELGKYWAFVKNV